MNQNKSFNKDTAREASFMQAYGIKSEIYVKNKFDADLNWEEVDIVFKGNYGVHHLIEKFKDGADNSTLYVDYVSENETKRFKKFIDAESYLVYKMRELHG